MKKIIKLIKLVVIIFSISSGVVHAEETQVEVSPPEPVMNESFFVTFHIKVSGDGDPYISFTPSGAQVMGKREQGVSISTVVINGKFTTTKEQNVVYELMADHSGSVTLRNIKIDVGGKSNNLKDVHINILSAPKKIPEAFMEAQITKTKAYVGEGLDINYYLYFKTSISGYDVKDFPKLNKFIKRFHHNNSPVEMVHYKNEVMKRILAYSARIYPEKPGTAVVDPMSATVQVVESSYNGFGFGSQRLKTKELSSNRIEIEVLPLPADNIPPGFTGLVGEHEFKLIPGKDKYLVNEPIEVKLEVRGKGALEKMEAPAIYVDPSLESFDTKGEVTEEGTSSVKKFFEYTYLARAALSLKTRTLSLSYFDPATAKYVEKKINVPGIDVSGTAVSNNGGNIKTESPINKNESSKQEQVGDFLSKWLSSNSTGVNNSKGTIPQQLGLVGPLFSEPSYLNPRNFTVLNLMLALFAAFLIAFLYFDFKNGADEFVSSNSEAKIIIKKIKKNGIEFSDLYKLLSMLDKKNKMANGGLSLSEIINESNLTFEAKKYFKESLENCEQKGYGKTKNNSTLKFENKFFTELLSKV